MLVSINLQFLSNIVQLLFTILILETNSRYFVPIINSHQPSQ
jgi:hypothetical protein